MSTVVSVPANEGVSVKNERDDPEINAMALKIKENNQKNASALIRQQAAATVYINRAGRSVSLTATTLSRFNQIEKNVISEKFSKDSGDSESIKGRFVWRTVGSCHLPCLKRIINNKRLELASVRIAENNLLGSYMGFLHTDIYASIKVKSHLMLESEAKLLNDINQKHTDNQMYGKDPFNVLKDCLVSIVDVEEFYTFLKVCYNKLMGIPLLGLNKCGFIRINSESVVPYCFKDDKKYVPLFYFEGETENLRYRAINLENWNLAYLKFCCKVQGIRNELFASDSCTVTSLEDIEAYFPPDTKFEEYWPARVVDTQLLSTQNSMTSHVSNSGSWIRAPPSVTINIPIPENNQQTLQTPVPAVPPQVMSMTNNSYQKGWLPNQMVNSYNIQAQPTQTHGYHAVYRNQSVAAQYYNANSPLQQRSGGVPLNNNSVRVPPPPLVPAGNISTSVTNNSRSYTSVTSMSQPMTTVYNQITNSGVMSHSNQIRQLYTTQRSNIGVHQQQHHQQQLQQQQLIAPLPVQPTYNSQSLSSLNGSNSRVANTQQRNALRSITAPASEIIDLSSPPSSPAPPETNVRTRTDWIRLPERQMWGGIQDMTSSGAFKIQKATLQGKTIHCINTKPYEYNSDLMVTIEELVRTIVPSSSVSRCTHILQKYLNTSLYSGNNEQVTVLRENGLLRSMFSENLLMAMLQDVTQVVLQLKAMVSKDDEQILHQYQNGYGKRKRMS